MKLSLFTKLFLILGLIYSSIYAQIGIGTVNPEQSSVLDVTSTNKGFLPPRMTTSERDAINGGDIAIGLVIYNEDTKCIEFYMGTGWSNPCGTGATPVDPLPANITLTAGQIKYITSIFDEDYLPYTPPTVVANTNTGTTGNAEADGSNEAVTIDRPGVLTTTGITIEIPYTVANADVALPAFSTTKTVVVENTEDGITRDVEFSYQAQTLVVGSGTITATIKAVGGDLNVKKLDLNAGLGTDLGILLADFNISLDNSGTTGDIKLKAVSGIPDRNILDANHRFIYLPVVAADGKTWLNNNLGANYANLNHGQFNPEQQATGQNDYHAYGSLFQWGRYSDGHELMNHSNATAGTPVSTVTSSSTSVTITPNNTTFYTGGNWLDLGSSPNATEDGLWQGEAGPNNPCPGGFRLPTLNEMATVTTDEGITTTATAASSSLAITNSGSRSNLNGNPFNIGVRSFFWTNEIFGSQITIQGFHTTPYTAAQSRALGLTVRCIKDETPVPLPVNITLTAGQIKYISSIFDEDYLPYAPPTAVANTNTGTTGNAEADGSNEAVTIDRPGVLTTTGITIEIPYTVANADVALPAFSTTETVVVENTEDGITRDVEFSYQA